jgi:uroporphyrinogen-III synthase
MLSLSGKRILITRTRRQASDLSRQLEALGAIPISVPSIEVVPPANFAVLDDALSRLGSFDWLVFTSANAVEVFAERRDPTQRPKKIAVIGPATARAVEAIGLDVNLVPPRYVAESLADVLISSAAGKQILLVRAEEARDVLPEALLQAGAKLTLAPAYRNQIPASSIPAIREVFARKEDYPDAVTLTSASTVRSLLSLLETSGLVLPAGVPLASIGPITSKALRDLGYQSTIEAKESTIPALVDALVQYFSVER